MEYEGDRVEVRIRTCCAETGVKCMRRASRVGVTSSGRIIGDDVQSAHHVAHCRLPAAGCLLWAAVHLLFNIPCCPLNAECCVLMVVCCMPNDDIVLLETSSRRGSLVPSLR